MKKIAFFICLGVAALTTSCSDVLEEEVYGQPTAQEMLANQENVARVVGQAYADVKWLHDHWGYWGNHSNHNPHGSSGWHGEG